MKVGLLLISLVLFLITVTQLTSGLTVSIPPLYNITHISLPGFNAPEGFALGKSGEIYVSDTNNHLVKKVDPSTGEITIVAGTGVAGFDSNTVATSAKLNFPTGLNISPSNTLLIADKMNHAIREVSNGNISTIAGKLGTSGSNADNSIAISTFLNEPKYVSSLASTGAIYFSDTKNFKFMYIRKDGRLYTASAASAGYTTNGVAVFAEFEYIFAESGSNRFIRTWKQSFKTYYSGFRGYADGVLGYVGFNDARGICYGPTREVYIADRGNHAIRKMTFTSATDSLQGYVSTVSGIGLSAGSDSVRLNSPCDVSVNSRNEVFILDTNNNRIRKMVPYCSATFFYNVTSNDCFGECATNCSGRGSCVTIDTCVCDDTTLWGGSTCEIPKCFNVLASDKTVCSGSGSCTSPNNCTCQNSSGPKCEIPHCNNIPANSTDVCSSRGQCIAPNTCNCTNPGYGGQNCEIPKCNNILSTNNSVCSGRGSCLAPNNCSCVDGYTGINCENYNCFNAYYGNVDVCSGKGKCVSYNNCSCQAGFYGENCQYYNCFGIRNDMKSVCSSVGNCSTTDTCNCTKSYYGRNCEMFNCYGKAFNSTNVCSSRGNCSAIDTCKCRQGYYGDECEKFDCFGVNSLNSTVCSNSGNCTDFDKCSCKKDYYGKTCELYDCFGYSRNNASVCSTRGSCISPNNCTCQNSTLWGGQNCELPKCNNILSGTVGVCLGRGSCLSPDNCNCSNPTLYGGSNCEIPKCSNILATNTSVCLGRGSCNVPNNCSCLDGYYGNNCQFYDCFGVNSLNSSVCSNSGNCTGIEQCKCKQGYFGDNCEKFDCYGVSRFNETVCSKHGACLSPNNCKCQNSDLWVGQNCEIPKCSNILATNNSVCLGRGSCLTPNNCSCLDGYYGSNCQYFDCFGVNSLNATVCSNSGNCTGIDQCKCKTGYYGRSCELFDCNRISRFNETVCSKSGTCIEPNKCSCLDGYRGLNCEQYSCFGVNNTNVSVCSRHGDCTSLDVCKCRDGYYGENCEKFDCYGVRSDSHDVCSSVGNCTDVNVCNCSKPYYGQNCEIFDCYGKPFNSQNVCSARGICSSANNCTCQEGYYGDECEKFDCFGVNSLNPAVCSNAGNCTESNTCKCKQGYYGDNCELFDCYGVPRLNETTCSSTGSCQSPNNCSCQLGYFGLNCETFNCSKVVGQNICSNGQQCSSSGKCICSEEWGGDKCDKIKCYSITFDNSTVCSGNGVCSGYNNCTCDRDWYGSECSSPKCFGIQSNNESVCSGKGNCQNPNECKCKTGYTGDKCQYNICFNKAEVDLSVCSGHGQCISPDFCKCSNSYVGNECEFISLQMDIENAIVYTYSDVLKRYLNDSVIDGCENIFEKNEFSKFGQIDLVKCQWRRNNFKIYLGYDHSIENGTVILSKFGISFQVDLQTISQINKTPEIQPLPKIIPSNQDLIIRSSIPSSYHHFKKFTQTWSSSSLSNFNFSDKTVIRIASNSLKNIPSFDIILNSSNSQNLLSSSLKTIQVNSENQPSIPSFTILVDNDEDCMANNCIVEIAPLSLNTSTSLEISGSFSEELSNKQMIRLISNSDLVDLKVIGTDQESQSSLDINLPIKISPVTNLDFRLTNVNRTHSLNSGKISVSLESDDPTARNIIPTSSISWYCYRTSFDKSNIISSNLCSGISSQIELDLTSLGFSSLDSGMLMIVTNLTVSGTTYSYFGYIEIVNSPNSIPKITPDFIPSVYPAGKDLSLYCVVESDSLVQFKWKLLNGKLRNNPNLEPFTISNILVGNSVEISLNIEQSFLIEGEFYEFELETTNSEGTSRLSLSSRIDSKPRFTCFMESLNNETDIIAYETLVSISCLTLPNERISNIVMEIHSSTNERLVTLSNSLKNTVIANLPYHTYSSESDLILVVKMVNEFGSISEFRKLFTTTLLPERISSDSNSLVSRIDFVYQELMTLRKSKPITIVESVNSLNALFSIIAQNETLTKVGESIMLLDRESKQKLNWILVEMMNILRIIPSLSYKADEKIVQLITEPVSKMFHLLNSISNNSFNNEMEWWLNWIFNSMQQAHTYYSSHLYETLLDSNHFNEINTLITLLSNNYSNNATKHDLIAQYQLQYYKLSGKSDGTTQIIQLKQQFNSKTFTISSKSLNQVSVTFPSDFSSNQISNLESKSMILSSLSMINNDFSDGNLMSIRPSLELSIYDKNSNLVKVDNLASPIILKFEGLFTSNKSSINTSCVYLDSSNNWSQSGIKSLTTITKQSGDLIYFNIECQVSHLSLFTVQELPATINPNNPIFTDPSSPIRELSNDRNVDNQQQGMDPGALAAAIAVPIAFVLLLIIVIIIILVLICVVWRMKKKPETNSHVTSVSTSTISTDIELVLENLPTQAYYMKPASGYSFQIDNALISSSFNPQLRYTNISRIGSGNVFKVIDSVKNCPKALKIIKYKSEEDVNTFLKEAVHLMNVTNVHICKINELFISTQDMKLCIDMDYFENDFSKLTNRNFNISEQLIKQIIYQSCLALEFSHCNEKCIHGNIKLSNLLIKTFENDNIHIMISDFAVSSFGNSTTTMNPIYSSPELVSGYKHYFNTDIYSLGVVMYQIMTKDLFTSISELYGHKEQKEVVQILKKTMLERYSNEIIDLVLSMLEKDNLLRPQAQDILSNPILAEFKKRKQTI